MHLRRQPTLSEDLVHQSSGHVRMQGKKSNRVSWSSAGYQAKAPFGDINIQEVGWIEDMPCINPNMSEMCKLMVCVIGPDTDGPRLL